MGISFLPGEPSASQTAVITASWNTLQISAYCSGNNLVIFTKNSVHLQTLYLPKDAISVDINTSNGKLAVVMAGNDIVVYTPKLSNFYNFNFHGRKDLSELQIAWTHEITISNTYKDDHSNVHCISWSDYTQLPDADLDQSASFLELPPEFNSETDCEFVTGSERGLTLHKLFYLHGEDGKKTIASKVIWQQALASPVFLAKFSPQGTCIASVGKYDKIVKLWHRCSFNTDFNEFELRCIRNKSYVTSLSWKRFHCLNDYTQNNLSVPVTPTDSHLKPSNSIIKNDFAHLYFSSSKGTSESNSLYSLANPTSKKRHNVLYTMLHDKTMMIHSTYKSEQGFELFESGSIDLTDNGKIKGAIWVSILDEPFVELAITKVLERLESAKEVKEEAKENLLELLSSHFELCLVLSASGLVRFFCISNLGSLTPSHCQVKLLYDSTTLNFTKFCLPHDSSKTYNVTPSMCYNYYPSEDFRDEAIISLLDLNKKTIRIIGFKLEDILSTKPKNNSSFGNLLAKFTGHNKSVQKIIRSYNGNRFLSVTRFKENCLWEPIPISNRGISLSKKNTIITPAPISNCIILDDTKVIALCNNSILLYDCSKSNTQKVDTPDFQISIGKDSIVKCFFVLPELEENSNSSRIVAIFEDHECKCWEVYENSIKTKEIENLPLNNGVLSPCITDVIPVGFNKGISYIGRDALISINEDGNVQIYYVIAQNGKVSWHLKNEFSCGLKKCSTISGSSIHKLAIAGPENNKVYIWDTNLGTLEYEEEFPSDRKIRDLDWTSTKYGQGILAIGFKSHSLLYTQLRYDYTNDAPIFQKIKKIDISDQTTHEIGDSIWLADGLLVIGAGNQFYLCDKSLDTENDVVTKKAIGTLEIISNDLLHLCLALNGPLPLYHPQIIIQLLLAGKSQLAETILKRLSKQLRQIDLGEMTHVDIDLGLKGDDLMTEQNKEAATKNKRYKLLFDNAEDKDNELTTQDCDILLEKLQKYKLPFMTNHQQITLSHSVHILNDIATEYIKILDFNGIRFFFTMKLFLVNFTKTAFRNLKESTVRIRDVVFALHSDNKDLLFEITKEEMKKMPGQKKDLEIDWLNCKRFGIPYWIDSLKLTEIMEVVAKNEFLKYQLENNGKRNPSVCAIYYLALKKKQVLIGLWKTAYGNSEKEKMIKFLSNDFTHTRWKSAALKNAFVLLGKHRYEDAASFFLLADSIKDCVSVIMKQMNDVALAIAVAKCYEGISNGDGMKLILQRSVIPKAIKERDRWTLSWCFNILKMRKYAVQVLVKPFADIIESFEEIYENKVNFKNNIPSKDQYSLCSKNIEDPVLLVMYDNLRNRKEIYYKGVSEIDPSLEFNFVLDVASMYVKLGCDWLALDLVSNWKFTEIKRYNKVNNDDVPLKSTLLDSFVDKETASVRKRPGDILATFMDKTEQPKSILDNFTEPDKRPNILDQFDTPKPVMNMLDDYELSKADANRKEQSYNENQSGDILDIFNGSKLSKNTKHNVNPSTAAKTTPKQTNGVIKKEPLNLLDQWT